MNEEEGDTAVPPQASHHEDKIAVKEKLRKADAATIDEYIAAQKVLRECRALLEIAFGDFDVLLAQDTVAFAQAQLTAIGQQLEQAKRNFEVGTATITDTHEAQSRYDLTTADLNIDLGPLGTLLSDTF